MDEFRNGRSRQSDDDFLRDCGLEPGRPEASIAIAVRRAVAGVGLVDPLFIRATDSYPGHLELLPLWDSMDWLTLILEIEREVGEPLKCHSSELLPPSFPLTVRWLVGRVGEIMHRLRNRPVQGRLPSET